MASKPFPSQPSFGVRNQKKFEEVEWPVKEGVLSQKRTGGERAVLTIYFLGQGIYSFFAKTPVFV
jgi:hypothetical protein